MTSMNLNVVHDNGLALNCMGCTACCEGDSIPLTQSEMKKYKYKIVDGEPELEKGADGNCIYLAAGIGCKVHTDKPSLCANFDCRRYLFLTPEESNHRMKTFPGFSDILRAAKRQKTVGMAQ